MGATSNKEKNPAVQYQFLKDKLRSTHDIREKNVLFKRLINLAGVMQFVISISKNN
jgi:hypothetical protein